MELKAVATLVKESLKVAYPGVKFTAKTSRYLSGDEIEIIWTGGPTEDEIFEYFKQDQFNTPDFQGVQGYRRSLTGTRKAS